MCKFLLDINSFCICKPKCIFTTFLLIRNKTKTRIEKKNINFPPTMCYVAHYHMIIKVYMIIMILMIITIILENNRIIIKNKVYDNNQ